MSEDRLCEAVERRRDGLLEDLKLHVETPTGPGGADAIARSREVITSRLHKIGAETSTMAGDPRPEWMGGNERIPTSSISTVSGGSGPSVLIAGHLDTVHPADGPFQKLEFRDDGTATGPGCVDMKGGLVIALHALEALHEVGASVNWSYFLNADEETGTYHSDAALRKVSAEHNFGI
ncbi:MAG: M20/M25/M40 family metallo-hydrolase, partial [Planctomycetota bacterium]